MSSQEALHACCTSPLRLFAASAQYPSTLLTPHISHDQHSVLTVSSRGRLVRGLAERGMDDAEGCSADAPPLRP